MRRFLPVLALTLLLASCGGKEPGASSVRPAVQPTLTYASAFRAGFTVKTIQAVAVRYGCGPADGTAPALAQEVETGSTGPETLDIVLDGLQPETDYIFAAQGVGPSGEAGLLEQCRFSTRQGPSARYEWERERSGIPVPADMTLIPGPSSHRNPLAWDRDRWRTHVSYTDENGREHWLFDSFLLIEGQQTGVYGTPGYTYVLTESATPSAPKKLWQQLLDFWFDGGTFDWQESYWGDGKTSFSRWYTGRMVTPSPVFPTGQLDALEDCIAETAARIGPPPARRYVVMGMPEPIYFDNYIAGMGNPAGASTRYWGDVDGEELDFSRVEDRIRACRWFIDETRAAFARKHLRDVFDRQWKSGKLPQIAPYANEDWFMAPMNGSVGWADVGILMPWRFYQKYGDRRILEDNYENMLRYARFMISRCGKWGGIYAKPLGISRQNRKYAVNAGQSYGEWAEPNDVRAFVWTDFAEPHPEESTAYTARVLGVMAEICELLGKTEPIPLLREYSEGAKRAYQEMAAKPRFTLDTDRQAKLVRPLYMDLLNEEQTAFAKKRLIQALDNYGWRLGTGFLSTPLILYVLAELDIEYAYRLLENEEIPGWLSMPKAGAKTIWEGWEGPKSDSGICSLNHYSKGAVCEWLFDTCCGVRVDGENHFVIAPRPGGHLTEAAFQYESIYGTVSSGWKKAGKKTIYSFSVPAGCTATVTFPGSIPQEMQPGIYQIEE